MSVKTASWLSQILFIIACFLLVTSIYLVSTKLNYLPVEGEQENALKASTGIFKKDSAVFVSFYSELNDLEMATADWASTDKHFSGQKSASVSEKIEYGPTHLKKISDFDPTYPFTTLDLTYEILSNQKLKDAIWVLTIEDQSGKVIFWEGRSIISASSKNWEQKTLSFKVSPEWFKTTNSVKIYPWNKGKEKFYLDDIGITYKGYKPAEEIKTENSDKDCIRNYVFDFDSKESKDQTFGQGKVISTPLAKSGKNCFEIEKGEKYGPELNKRAEEFLPKGIKEVSASIWIYPLAENINFALTCKVISRKELMFWPRRTLYNGRSNVNIVYPKNTWTKINATFRLNLDRLHPEDEIRVQCWNMNKASVLVDDFTVVMGASEKKGNLFSQSQNFGSQYLECVYPNIDQGAIDIFSFTEFHKGRFLQNQNKTEQIIAINKDGPILLAVDENANPQKLNAVKLIGGSFNHLNSPGTKKYVGDFQGKGIEQILVFDFTKRVVSLHGFSQQEKVFKLDWSGNFNSTNGDFNLNSADKIYVGDFNGDHKSDLFIFQTKTKHWTILSFQQNSWTVIANGTINFANAVAGHFDPANPSDVLLVSTSFSSTTAYQLLSFNTGLKTLCVKSLAAPGVNENLLAQNDQFWVLRNSATGMDEVWRNHPGWRYDIKRIQIEPTAIKSIKNIDFIGYPLDQNPKYYEQLLFLPGYFRTANQLDFLLTMNNQEDLKELPKAVQLYTLKP